MNEKYVSESRAIKAAIVLPPDTNNYGTMFGGRVMAYIDDLAAISASRHCRNHVVTASTDSVDFLHPILNSQAVCLEAFVTWSHKTSMEVFVKVIGEDLLTGEKNICATSFLTFVAIDEHGTTLPVPDVIPETAFEKELFNGAPARAEARRLRRENSRMLADKSGTDQQICMR